MPTMLNGITGYNGGNFYDKTYGNIMSLSETQGFTNPSVKMGNPIIVAPSFLKTTSDTNNNFNQHIPFNSPLTTGTNFKTLSLYDSNTMPSEIVLKNNHNLNIGTSLEPQAPLKSIVQPYMPLWTNQNLIPKLPLINFANDAVVQSTEMQIMHQAPPRLEMQPHFDDYQTIKHNSYLKTTKPSIYDLEYTAVLTPPKFAAMSNYNTDNFRGSKDFDGAASSSKNVFVSSNSTNSNNGMTKEGRDRIRVYIQKTVEP